MTRSSVFLRIPELLVRFNKFAVLYAIVCHVHMNLSRHEWINTRLAQTSKLGPARRLGDVRECSTRCTKHGR